MSKKHPKAEKKMKPAPKSKETSTAEQDKTSDFGGLPQRNLKKNLGCG